VFIALQRHVVCLYIALHHAVLLCSKLQHDALPTAVPSYTLRVGRPIFCLENVFFTEFSSVFSFLSCHMSCNFIPKFNALIFSTLNVKAEFVNQAAFYFQFLRNFI
jgi:hypothetical protein